MDLAVQSAIWRRGKSNWNFPPQATQYRRSVAVKNTPTGCSAANSEAETRPRYLSFVQLFKLPMGHNQRGETVAMISCGLSESENSLSIGRSNLLIAATFAVFAVIILIPVLAVETPPLVDYPNHLAKMYLAVHLANDPYLQEYYQVGLRLTPNLAQDFIVPLLARFTDVSSATRIFLGWSLVQIAIGTMALHFAATGRLGWWPLGAFALLYNWVVAWGFLNYLFTVGLALNLFALWIWLAERPAAVRAGLLAIIAAVVFLFHMFALGVLGLCIGSFQLWRTVCAVRADPKSSWRNIRAYTELLLGLPALLTVILLWSASPAMDGSSKTEYGGVREKLTALLSPALINGGIWDQLLFLLLVIVILSLIFSSEIRLLPRLRYSLGVVAIAAILMPTWILGVYGMDFRLPFVAGCILFAAADFRGLQWPTWAIPVGIAVVALTIVRIGFLTMSWVETDARFSELRTALRAVPEGSKVLPVVNTIHGAEPHFGDYIPLYWHVSAFAVVDRSSFDPLIFSGPARQSVSVRPEHRAYDAFHSVPTTLEQLLLTEKEYPSLGDTHMSVDNDAGYWRYWWRNFDYVLWINFGQGENPAPDRLDLVEAGSFFKLLAVRNSLQSGDEQ